MIGRIIGVMAGRNVPDWPSPDVLALLLAGLDSGRQGTGANDETGMHSDTTIIAHLDKDGTTTLVSIPRDTMVTIPSYKDKQGNQHDAHKAKFNSAISEGGASLLVRTVEKLTNIRVDHYVSVDLEGFAKISNALNGVPVCILQAPAGYAGRTNLTSVHAIPEL